jgi:D-alanyl-D-alanine carboxypeptidase
LQDFFKTYFFEAFEMNNTSMYLRSNPIKNTRRTAELFAEDFECSTMTSLSADWAGGGLLSTSQDLIRFHEALNSGRIISDTTLRLMQNWTRETKGMYYGFGLRKIVLKELFPMLPDVYIVGHSGSTGSFMFYCPQLDVYLAGTLNQTDEVKNSVVLMVKILSFIKKEHKR